MMRKIKSLLAVVILAALFMSIPVFANAKDGNDMIVQSDEYPMVYVNEDGSTVIEITKEFHFDSDCFVARIVTDNPGLLKTCFAHDDFTQTEVMTKVAKEHDAVFMVNADWCTLFGYNNFVIRNGEVYRKAYPYGAEGAYFCVMSDGHLEFIRLHATVEEALEAGVVHSFTFYGVNLFKNGEIDADNGSRHPRTFMGEVLRDDGKLEYIIVVADGRRADSKGLNHYQEASILYDKGCRIGYNLDGGGSSEMVFDGKILNTPSSGHERHDHDFIYVKLGD